MIDVTVDIAAIIMYCDESILGVNLGQGYTIEKVYLEAITFKDKITDGRGQLNIAYFGSKMQDDNGTYFMCLKKNAVYQIEGPSFNSEQRVLVDNDFMCPEELEAYKETEMSYLHKVFSLLRLYKDGNIGLKDVFFEHRFRVMGFISNTMNHNSVNESRNTVDTRVYSLSHDELTECNQFLIDNAGASYGLMKPCIDEFVWGLEQIDVPTGFENYTTALEMILLETNQRGKKQALANRVSVLIGSTAGDIRSLHGRMLDFYRFRSESLHEGDGSNITKAELVEMEDIVRRVLKKCLLRCNNDLINDNTKTWQSIKEAQINDLVALATAARTNGILQ